MKWLAKYRYNYIDLISMITTSILFEKGLFLEVIITVIVGISVSVLLEYKYGESSY